MAMSGGQGDLNSEINVTPLVDVMLVLLVVFMVTAPMMSTGVDIDLPETKAQVVADPQGQLTLSITPSKQLFLSGVPLQWSELKDKLIADPRLTARKELYVEADKDLPYSVVVTAMAVAREAGIIKLQMLTDPAAKLDIATLDVEGAPTPAPADGKP